MTNVRRSCLWVFCCLALSAPSGFGQTEPVAPAGPPPAHLALIEGQAYVDRDGRSEPAVANLPLLDGDRLRTEEGRLEVILPDGSLLHLDRYTTADVLAADLLRVLQGRVYVIVRGTRNPDLAARYQLDTSIASVQTGGPGEFRVSAADGPRGTEVELAVFRGQATLANDLGAEEIRAGERAIVREGLAPSNPQYFNSARWDAFDRWSAQRRDERLGTVSVQYLPADLEVYASTFDQYGTWRDDPIDGAVWYPSVGVDWRPYSVGYWRSYPAWDAFWIGGDPWGWPTHHYGRWGFSIGFGWHWIPARRWAPAWVSWAVSPGYVSWCALGRHDYPVFGHFGLRGAYAGNHVDPWRGWTVLPRQHFGSRLPVNRLAFDGRRLDDAARSGFAVQRRGPVTGYAVPRGLAGGAAAPRGDRGGVPSGPATRPDPSAAARVLSSQRPGVPGTAARRTFPAGESRAFGPRTEAPPATPDITAFGNRRDPALQRREDLGSRAPGAISSGARERDLPGTTRSDRPPSASPPESVRRRSAWPNAGQSVPPVPPRSYDTPTQAPSRENPYFRGNSGGVPDRSPRPGVPRAYDTPTQAPSRENPYFRGNSGGMPGGEARPRAPERGAIPQYSPPGPSRSPRDGGSPSAQPGASSRPRDGGSRMPSGPVYRRGGAPDSSSSPPAAPRYNPGSAESRQRSGGPSSPPPRRRGGVPD